MGKAIGFTEDIKIVCLKRCAEFGDPPCWRLPDLVDPSDDIMPCDECQNAAMPGRDKDE